MQLANWLLFVSDGHDGQADAGAIAQLRLQRLLLHKLRGPRLRSDPRTWSA